MERFHPVDQEMVQAAVERTLTGDHRYIVILVYGLYGFPTRNIGEIARALEISRQRVEQKLAQAISMLRDAIRRSSTNYDASIRKR